VIENHTTTIEPISLRRFKEDGGDKSVSIFKLHRKPNRFFKDGGAYSSRIFTRVGIFLQDL